MERNEVFDDLGNSIQDQGYRKSKGVGRRLAFSRKNKRASRSYFTSSAIAASWLVSLLRLLLQSIPQAATRVLFKRNLNRITLFPRSQLHSFQFSEWSPISLRKKSKLLMWLSRAIQDQLVLPMFSSTMLI